MHTKDLFLDLEGIQLGKTGTICLLQSYYGKDKVDILDIWTDPEPLREGGGMRRMLEDPEWTKYMFDPRGDAANLYSSFGIRMKNVICLQLAEVAFDRSMGYQRRFVNGLCKVLDRVMTIHESHQSKQIKERGRRYFCPDLGGDYQVFCQRPLPDALVEYCELDVAFLPRLKEKFYDPLPDNRKEWVKTKSQERAELGFGSNPLPSGRDACLAPL